MLNSKTQPSIATMNESNLNSAFHDLQAVKFVLTGNLLSMFFLPLVAGQHIFPINTTFPWYFCLFLFCFDINLAYFQTGICRRELLKDA